MAAVRCPWCDRRLVAADGDILTSALSIHFHRDHGLILPDREQIRGGREGCLSGLAEVEGATNEREVRGGAEAYGAGITQRGSDLYGVSGPPHTIAVQRVERLFVQCPLCGFEARGEDEGSLSRNLREHMRENNELEGGEG